MRNVLLSNWKSGFETIIDLWQGSSISWHTSCQQYFVCFQTQQIGIISHGLFWQLNNQLHTTDTSVLMFGQRIDMFSVHTHRLKNSIKLKSAVIETMAANRKISMHTPGINVHLPSSMEMIVKLAKTFLSCKGWQIADSSCPRHW